MEQGHLENRPALEKLLSHTWGRWALPSPRRTSLIELSDMLLANKVSTVACAHAVASCKVTVPAQKLVWGPRIPPP